MKVEWGFLEHDEEKGVAVKDFFLKQNGVTTALLITRHVKGEFKKELTCIRIARKYLKREELWKLAAAYEGAGKEILDLLLEDKENFCDTLTDPEFINLYWGRSYIDALMSFETLSMMD